MNSVSKQLFNAFWRSFEREFEPFKVDLKFYSKEVKNQIALAAAQTDHQERQLQTQERDAALEGRSFIKSLAYLNKKENDEFREWRIRRNNRSNRIQPRVHQ